MSAILREPLERRRKSSCATDGGSAAVAGCPFAESGLFHPSVAAAFELPGIHISRIETLDFDEDGSR